MCISWSTRPVTNRCIGVDPYYLTHKAQEIGYHPEVILAGRRINDGMGAHVATQVLRLMAAKSINPVGARVLVLGLTFKENCPDLRNTRVIDIISELRKFNCQVDVHDPWVNAVEATHEYGFTPIAEPAAGAYDAIVLAVAHRQFAEQAASLRRFGKPLCVIYDVKHILPRDLIDARL